MTEPSSWSDLERRDPPQPSNPRFAELCTLVFSAGPGKELLALLRERYFDSPFNPLVAGEPALRVRATQQALIRELETARDRALKPKP